MPRSTKPSPRQRIRHEPVGGMAALLLFAAFFLFERAVALAAGYGALRPGHAPQLSEASHALCVVVALTVAGVTLWLIDRLCLRLTGWSASDIAFELLSW